MSCFFDWAKKAGLSTLDLPKSAVEIQAQLSSLIMELENSSRVLIILDAVDQLDDGMQIDEWLPSIDTKNISWVISTTIAKQSEVLKRRGWKELNLLPLNQDSAQKFLIDGLANYRKKLSTNLLDKCLTHSMASQPLFLKVMLEEIRLYGNHESLGVYIDGLLSNQTIDQLFDAMLSRLDRSYGKELISVLVLIGLSKFGVSESELRECLNLRTIDVHRVILAVKPYLSSHNGLLSPFHEGFRRALLQRLEVETLIGVWCDYWSHSNNLGRRFDEYPAALIANNKVDVLHDWLWEDPTLDYAFNTFQIESLPIWYSITKKLPVGLDEKSLGRWSLSGLQGLKEISYQLGFKELEAKALKAQINKDGLSMSQWWIESSLIHYRGSDQNEAQKDALQAVSCSNSSGEILNSKMNLIQMYAFGDSPREALKISQELFNEIGNALRSDRQSEAYLHQYTSFACHFLDLNKQSYLHSLKASELYSSLSRRYDQGICWVNAADGAWGVGDYKQAEYLFEKSLHLSRVYKLPNVEDIALICLANLRMTESLLPEAAALYEQGISLAISIGHDWDVLYGKIYQSLTLGMMKLPHIDLVELSNEARENGYDYLADVALAHQIVLTSNVGWLQERLVNSIFPGPKAYGLAASIVNGEESKHDLLSVMESIEGIKRRRGESSFSSSSSSSGGRQNFLSPDRVGMPITATAATAVQVQVADVEEKASVDDEA
jgi:hypothetical protein